MTAPRQWFRMYAEAVDDEKLRLLAFEDRWHFVAILCLKAMGTLDSDAPHLERRIALKLGLQLPQLDELKRRLIDVHLIDDGYQPVKWNDRQYESDVSTQRVRKYREKREGNVSRTVSRNVSETPPEQSRAEQKQSRSETRASRLPDDFSLTPERRLVAEAERLPADRTFAKFCDYWRSLAGVKARKVDWDATWRNWCRSDLNRSNGSGKKTADANPYRGAE